MAAWAGWRGGKLSHKLAHRLHANVDIEGSDVDQIHRVVAELCERHRVLGAAHLDREGHPVLDLSAKRAPRIERARLGREQHPEEISRLTSAFLAEGFSLDDPPLKARVLEHAGNPRRLILAAHHLIADNLTMALLADEVRHRLAGALGDIQHEEVDYGSYLLSMQTWFEGEASSHARAYWRSQLPSDARELARPLGGLASDTGRGGRVDVGFSLGGALLNKVDRVARKVRTTRFTVLLAVQQLLVAHLNDAAYGSVVVVTDGREHSKIRRTIGYMADKLVFRMPIDRGMTFSELLRLVHEQRRASHSFAFFRYDRLVEEFWPEMVGRLSPSAFNFNRGSPIPDAQGRRHPGFALHPIDNTRLSQLPARANYSINATDCGGIIVGTISFSSDGARLVLSYLRRILSNISETGKDRLYNLL